MGFSMNPEQLLFYIDGFKLYFGLKERGWRPHSMENTAMLPI